MATSDINQNKCINVNKFHLVLLVHPCTKGESTVQMVQTAQ